MTNTPTFLVATDFSRSSQAAINHAAAHAMLAGAKLLIVHVLPIPSLDAGEGLLHRGAEPADFAAAERELQAIRPEGVEVERHLAKGDPAEQILELAQARGVGLIVIGTNGRSGLLRALLGSVAESVLKAASCPVLTLRIPEALS